MPKTLTATALQQEAQAFRDEFSTVLLATADSSGQPDASYSPYIADTDGKTVIFVSELASHTQNLFENQRASLMFITDESASRNLFARRRLMLTATAEHLSRDHQDWHPLMAKMSECHGKTIALLMSLPDFHLFRFSVTGGSWVRGFGQAYTVLNDQLEILAERRTR